MRILIFISFIFLTVSVDAQQYIGRVEDLWQQQRNLSEFKTHTGISPQIRKNQPILAVDSTKNFSRFRIVPVADLGIQSDTELYFRTAAGIGLEGAFGKSWYARASVMSGWSVREGNNQSHTFFLPGNDHRQYIYTDIRARIGFTPNKIIHLAAGIDNQFFGEGNRSLIQGDQVAPNPFAMMRVNFWHLEYGLLYQMLRERNNKLDIHKYSATHYLSWNATRNLNISLFESVLFQPKDSVFNRGFEVEYLNPIVFFRPQEYSLGSSDNVLLALQTSYTLKNHTIYGQLSLDEFILSEIRDRTYWWGNKYGAQLGIKGKIRDSLYYRIEGNLVRPYTYSHIHSGANYGNLGRPLGHSYGSNFAELFAEAQWLRNKWNIKGVVGYVIKGYDPDSLSWGGDIYRNYVNRPMDYGHHVGQGLTVRTISVACEFSYLLNRFRLRAFAEPQLQFLTGDFPDETRFIITAGLRSELFGPRRRF